jgi:hypothetical protein
MRPNFSIRTLLLAAAMLVLPMASSAQIVLTVDFAPPPLPVYDQPVCPGDGYIWTPGYWAYTDQGYFWVPGTWVMAPEPGFLWTPGYWGWGDTAFVFHEGYWGPHVGFYGGIDYGFGYVGVGYEGGYWNNGAFFYNRSVNNVTNVTNVYEKTVVVNEVRVSYNGGEGGITARPTQEEEAAANERHVPPTSVQTEHVRTASSNHELYESENHGRPPIAATAKPGEFSGGVVAARSAAPSYKPATERRAGPATANNGERPAAGTERPNGEARPGNEAERPNGEARPAAGQERPNSAESRPAEGTTAERPANPVHPKDLPPVARPTYNTGNANLDKKLQQQQEKLSTRQEQERQQLQQKQEAEHQRLTQTKANDSRQQQVEQRHQQQTQKLAQRQTAQQQKLQARQPAASRKPEKP